MKKLKKILLINWLYYSRQLIDIGDINFLTGKTGAGKSTIIDALQIVLLGELNARNFNKAANESSQRTLDGYLRADIDGTGACIFGKDGITAAIQTNQNILNLAVSGKGTAVLALEDGTTSLLQFYDRSGKKLDISATLEMSLSGFPMDIALSPDGNGLAVAAGAYAGGGLAAQIVFYNFSVGKNETNRLVGYFSYENAIFPELRYMGAGTVAAVGDDRLVLFDMSTENKPQVAQEIRFDTSLTAVHVGGTYVSVVRPAADGTGLNLEVYGRSGKKAFAAPIAEVPRYLGDSDDYVIMTSESGLKIWDYKGKLRFEGLLAQDAQTVFAMDRRTLIQPSGSFLYRYRLR